MRARRSGALIGLVGLLVGCVPAAATAEGRAITDLYTAFMVVAVAVGGTVFGLATFAILRYRAGKTDLPVQTRGSLRLEAVWTAIPILIIAGLFAGTLLVLNRVEARSSQPGVELRVEAFRWGWSFSYPTAGVTVSGVDVSGPEAVLPVGEPIRVTLAANDVVHAFYVPVFLFKRDAIPGRESVFEFTVDEPGTYRGQCAEFCGIYHYRMPFSIRAVSRAEYDAWLSSQATTP
jgi:cytochrome c oxidase subunit 2